MRVLILSCNNGQGHNSCAMAIQDGFSALGSRADIVDAMEYLPKGISNFAASWHVRIYRYFPWLFSKGYSYSEVHPSMFGEQSLVYKLLVSGGDKLYEVVTEGNYDVVLCTHVFAAVLLTNMQQKYALPIKTGYITTDYAYTPGTEKSALDFYYLPCAELMDSFTENGIARGKLIASGIPVQRQFYSRTVRSEAKAALGIPADSRHLLIMCGSMGCGPIPEIVGSLAGIVPDGCITTVVCGTNKRLKKELDALVGNDTRFKILGYTTRVSQLMDSADLFLTKPGGISTTEAAVKELPMAFVNVVSGCELHNLDYFTQRGYAFTSSAAELPRRCVDALFSGKTENMKKRLMDFPYKNAAQVICQTVAK